MSDFQSRKTFRSRLEHMIESLRGDIVTGKKKPGEYLASERELAKIFTLSNKLVRAALERLAEEGLIEKIPRVGNRVSMSLPDHAVSLRFGYHASLEHEADMSRLIAEFRQAYPSIHVQPVPIAFQHYSETVKEHLEAGLLDVVSMNYNNFHDFKVSGSIGLLQPFDHDPSVYSFVEEPYSFNGKPYVRPLVFSPLILCYNRDHLAEAGIHEPFRPDTWDQLLTAAAGLTVENERFGFYFFLHSKNRWPVFVLQAGTLYDGSVETVEQSVERIVEGLNACRRIIYAPNTFPTFLSGSDADAEELFLQGKVSIIMTSYMALNRVIHSGLRFDIAPLPVLRVNKTVLMSIGLAVSAKSKIRSAARTFVDFLLSEQAQLTIRRHTYSIPARRTAAEWQGEETDYRPPGFSLYHSLIPSFSLYTDLGLSVTEMDLIMKEARLYWSKLQSESNMRRNIAGILLQRQRQVPIERT